MKYVAVRDCTDVGGRWFRKGDVAELDGKAKHSKYLEKVAAEPAKPAEPEKPVEPEKPGKPEQK